MLNDGSSEGQRHRASSLTVEPETHIELTQMRFESWRYWVVRCCRADMVSRIWVLAVGGIDTEFNVIILLAMPCYALDDAR